MTFVFTDVVGSTQAFARFGDVYVAAARRMHALIAATTDAFGGAVVSTDGDGAFLAFATAPSALDAVTEIQRRLEAEAGEAAKEPNALVLRIRAGAHTGHATPLGDDYVSLAVHHAARIAATARAGQLIVSESVQHDLPAPRGERLGAFRLKDIPEPVVLWRVLGDNTPPHAEPVRRTNVAAARTSFLGRERELATLRRLFESPGIVTITGPGGLGKSRLASELAYADAERYAGGAWLAELSAVDDPAQLTDAVGSALGIEAGSAIDALARELERRGDVLIVLDGCEHLIDAVAELVADLVERCDALRILATSRESLEVNGERVLRLRAIENPERLFAERAAAVGVSFSDADAPAVSRICRQLDGLPLAIELAAARTSSMPIVELAEALGAGELRLQRRSGHRHQRTLHDLVAWSLRLLDHAERTALVALSVFPGRFGAADARELLCAIPDARATALPELARRSLVDLDGDRYRLLVTIRDAARRELGARPDLDRAAHRSLVRWALDGCPPRGAPPRTDEDVDTVRGVHAALRWGLDAGLTGLSPLMRRLRSWAQQNGDTAGVRDLALRALAHPAPVTADEVVLQSAAIEVVMGLGWAPGRNERILARIRELLATARATGDPFVQFEADSVAATTLSKYGDHEGAMAAAREALALTEREPAVRFAHGMQLGDMALLHYVGGDLDAAADYMRRAIDVHRRNGDNVNVAVNQCNLAEVMLDRGQADTAEVELRSALRAAGAARTLTALAMGLLVEALAAQGAVGEAVTLSQEALPMLIELAEGDASLTAQRDRLAGVVRSLSS
ncbi:MAG TPA: AAA family ATPase [Casimicrobiaceae bacterium]